MPAVETLGCVTVICSDKTGTLTKNEMTATCVVTPEGRRAEVTGIGYVVDGGRCTYEGEPIMGYSHQEFASIIETGLEGCRQHYKRVREMPFSSDTKYMSVQCDQNGQTVFFVKGALDRILQLCDSYLSSDATRKVNFLLMCLMSHIWTAS
ncbi:unnamed protein product [Cylicostephanus goldi]|uniref:Cation-transporting P-type ATPase C-terminal domain-containing protein n=1 Tax=Cylicostephanus goldi TaxID=71465 RepID=A0A3P6R2H7_CYLGO|nr:unnamed protein product [Cylicostephanus goldi]